jgi:hypothetical protein
LPFRLAAEERPHPTSIAANEVRSFGFAQEVLPSF